MTVSRDTTTSWDATAGNVPFRAWAQAVHDKILAAGLVQTSDTGQINLATVVRPAADALAGFEIWRFNDAEQATNPIFIRVNYYSGDAVTEQRLMFSVGKGSSGAGVLTTEMATAPTVSGSAGTADSASRLIHACFTDGAFVFYAAGDATVATAIDDFLLVVEREKKRDLTLNGNVQAMVARGAAATPRVSRYSSGAWANSFAEYLLPSSVADPDAAQPIGGMMVEGSPTIMRSLAVGGGIALGESGSVTVDGEARAFIGGPIVAGLTPIGVGTAVSAALFRHLLRNE